MKAKSVEDKK
jgi:hypothetical protein